MSLLSALDMSKLSQMSLCCSNSSAVYYIYISLSLPNMLVILRSRHQKVCSVARLLGDIYVDIDIFKEERRRLNKRKKSPAKVDKCGSCEPLYWAESKPLFSSLKRD